ncbi:helix-turn-helix transcriptional regulator [Haloarchaeobius sp. DYHT-AS-18]|uniref:helix-turn-helix transcriptional regulator n=1 Tax=Haloarchaeobius sp. DYHT-AS-18 TaxID=3446117 RepID=UPI003EB9DB9E
MGPNERIRRLLRDHGGRMSQQAIIEQTGWSPSKTSRELCSMEQRDAIVRAPLGREKIVCLPEAAPDAMRAR